MRTLTFIIAFVIIALFAAGGGYYFGRTHATAARADQEPASAEPDEGSKPVVPVVVAPLKIGEITETATCYGSVVAEPGEVRVVSVPFESRIVKIHVTPGQHVDANADVIELDASPDAMVALQEAKNAVEAAARDLQQTEHRFNAHLATNQELFQAQQAAQSAKLRLQSLTERGVGQSQHLRAQIAGIVNKVNAQEGQIVPAGAAMIELAAGNRIEVRLGAEPEDVQSLKQGQKIRLCHVGRQTGAPIEGTVRLIGQRVDPQLRLVDVRVALPSNAQLMLESFVMGEITNSSPQAMIVPRDSALPDENGQYFLFTVKNDRAVKHAVKIGLQNNREVEVISDELKPDEMVVVSGNYQLKDGMEVTIESAPATPQPATAPAAAASHEETKP